MKRLKTYKVFKKMNESISEKDIEWKLNFTQYYLPEDIVDSIKALLKKYKIPFEIKEVHDEEEEIIKIYFKFGYGDISLKIEIDFHGPVVVFHSDQKGYNNFMLDDMDHLNNKLIKLVQSDVNKALFKINEELTEKNIEKDPNTSSEEKEKLEIRLNIDQYNKFKSKKNVFEKMFTDIETEIDVTTLNKLIGDNPFLKEYSQLLYKKRDSILTQKAIDQKMEKIEQLKKEISNINSNSNTTDNNNNNNNNNTDTTDTDNINEDFSDTNVGDIDPKMNVNDRTSNIRKEISQLESEVSDLKKKLSTDNIDKSLNKWNNQLLRTISDLKSGKPLLVSNISYMR